MKIFISHVVYQFTIRCSVAVVTGRGTLRWRCSDDAGRGQASDEEAADGVEPF